MKRRQPMTSRKRPLVYAGAVVAAAVVALFCWAAWALYPPRQGGVAHLDIAPGTSTTQVARACQTLGLVRSARWFQLYLVWVGANTRIRAGTYDIPRGTSLPQLAQILESGRAPVVRVTIPEGFTVVQIADRLQSSGVCTRADFLNQVQHGVFPEPLLQHLPRDPRIKYRLEGYLFPDTYDFVRGEPAYDVVDEMLRNFERHVDGSITAQLSAHRLTLAQLITEASLIEREAKVDRERPIIASVIDNRLHHKPPMKLQIDATLEYILGHREVITVADTKVKDPYNTYLYPGLPPGPIANPGMASILAALHPDRTPYLYYVAKYDGSGEHYFATTAAQQLQNERRSAENLKRLEAHGT